MVKTHLHIVLATIAGVVINQSIRRIKFGSGVSKATANIFTQYHAPCKN